MSTPDRIIQIINSFFRKQAISVDDIYEVMKYTAEITGGSVKFTIDEIGPKVNTIYFQGLFHDAINVVIRKQRLNMVTDKNGAFVKVYQG